MKKYPISKSEEVRMLKEVIAQYWNDGHLKQDAGTLGRLNRKGIGFWFLNKGDGRGHLDPNDIFVRHLNKEEHEKAKS